MMYKIFIVKKVTESYADTIEMFGLSNLISQILSQTVNNSENIIIKDKGSYYEVKSKSEISEELINSLEYFPIFKWVIRDFGETFEEDCFDYPKQREYKKEKQEAIQSVRKEHSSYSHKGIRDQKLNKINNIYENDKRIYPELDVYSQIITPNNIISFRKLYKNFYLNKDQFQYLIKYILDYYSDNECNLDKSNLSSFMDKAPALQIYNPTSGKGVNKPKASGASTGGVKLSWVSETMKISGALSNMLCQLVKVGGRSYDLKIIVPDFKRVKYSQQRKIVQGLKKNIKGNTPIKVDIFNLLLIIKELIINTEEYQDFQAANVLSGLNSTYQKDLGQNKAVVNIGKLNTPAFIKFNNEDEAIDWIEIINEQIQIIGSIEEMGDSIQGLINYRTFFTSSHFESWMKFSFWFASYVMSRLSQKKYIRTFRVSTLNKIFNNMKIKDLKITEIIENEGFQKVAYAIRKSTVTLQFTPKESRKFEVRYGLAQTLQNKSKTTQDLAEFIGDFIATYNAETARKAELSKGFRLPIRDNELNTFYPLLDKCSSKVIGSLLASYGFALEEKEEINMNNENDETE